MANYMGKRIHHDNMLHDKFM